MNFLKSLLLCFLFFGLGNFKAQNNILELKLKTINKFQKLLDNKYKDSRNNISLIKDLNNNLLNLKQAYTSKISRHLHNYDYSDINNTKLYESFLKYPDVNYVLLNRSGAFSNEKISDEEKQKYNELFLEIAKQIPNETYIELSKITDEINRDKFALTVPYRFEIFQDLFDENQRKRIDIINFLLWNVE